MEPSVKETGKAGNGKAGKGKAEKWTQEAEAGYRKKQLEQQTLNRVRWIWVVTDLRSVREWQGLSEVS